MPLDNHSGTSFSNILPINPIVDHSTVFPVEKEVDKSSDSGKQQQQQQNWHDSTCNIQCEKHE